MLPNLLCPLLTGSVAVLSEAISKPEKKGKLSNANPVFLEDFAILFVINMLALGLLKILRQNSLYLDS